ncbi:coiled-coil domain-containing protein 137-like [Denticeps clupeoides]|uniref:CC137 protein n=1 Tax=Denticeps clupeoides TaxID=299321 RepID=A0AAY4CZP1_9TELE|nr:coiled-coil domain-containing protein 137-like [Denticeps clupeoides]XP_028842702.1 coiled-coil domain-containing protein 137-like [Denticeps clupeoides]
MRNNKHSKLKTETPDKERKKKPKRDNKPTPEEHLSQIPFRLREIMKSKEEMKLGPAKKKKMPRAAVQEFQIGEIKNGDIPVPVFRRKKRESEKAYVHRMSRAAQYVMFLSNNQGQRQPELDLKMPEKQESKTEKQKSEKKREFDRLRLQRLKKKKTDRKEQKEEEEMFTDKVEFGEVAMAPPSLNVKPRKAHKKPQGAPKGLLLNTLLGHTAVSSANPSMARKRMMEEERERVVQVYRQLKKQKQEQQELRVAAKQPQ